MIDGTARDGHLLFFLLSGSWCPCPPQEDRIFIGVEQTFHERFYSRSAWLSVIAIDNNA